ATGARGQQDRLDAPGGVLRVTSMIPVARGLGSSAAAIVAGIALADAAAGRDFDSGRAFLDALAYESHPDNIAPAALGGLVAVVPAPGAPRALRLPLSEDVGFAYAAPAAPLATAAARAALPATVAHAAAARSAARAIA